MAGPEQRLQIKRVFVPKGGEVRIILGGGGILDVRNPDPSSSYTVEHKLPSAREAQREQLRAEFPGILFPHVRARLNQHGYQLLGGEETSGEMTLMETNDALERWMEQARASGISNREILISTQELLQQVAIGAKKMGERSSLVKGINTEIAGMIDEVWGVKRPKN